MLFKTLQWQQALALSERGASSSLTRTAGQQIIPNWVGGKDAALDVTIITPLQAVTMPGAANTAGHALNHAFGRKVNGAEEECRRQGVAFLPMVAETFGGWHSAAQREVKKRSWAPPLQGTLSRRMGKPSPISGAGWASSSSGAMPPSWATGCSPSQGPYRRHHPDCNIFQSIDQVYVSALSLPDYQCVPSSRNICTPLGDMLK